MKQINLVTLLLMLFIQNACNQGTKDEKAAEPDAQAATNAVQYDKGLKPLEYNASNFKTYRLLNKNKVNADIAKSRMNEILALSQKKQLRFLQDTAKDPESKYIGFRRSDDASGVFEMNRITGRIVFNSGLKEYNGDLSTEGLPTEQEAVTLAKRYMTQIKLVDDEKELSKPVFSGLEMSAKKDGGKAQIYKKMITVRYNRIKDGMPVEGASRLIFSFGKKGELTSMIADWGKWEASVLSAGAVIDPKEITRLIEKKILAETGGAKQILVTKREVVLYDDGQGLMEPAVYVTAMLKYTRRSKDGKEQEYSIPYDFYQPLQKSSAALFPHVKDQQLKVQPRQNNTPTKDTARNKDDE
jgi:hypothetical protein